MTERKAGFAREKARASGSRLGSPEVWKHIVPLAPGAVSKNRRLIRDDRGGGNSKKSRPRLVLVDGAPEVSAVGGELARPRRMPAPSVIR